MAQNLQRLMGLKSARYRRASAVCRLLHICYVPVHILSAVGTSWWCVERQFL